MDDEPSEAAPADGSGNGGDDGVIVISARGDVVLDVVFETSHAVLREARREARRRARRAGGTAASASAAAPPQLQAQVSMAFRVEAAALKKSSRYFANLLGDTRFQEARTVEAALAALALEGQAPGDAGVHRLPRVRIDDDDEGSRTAGRERVFAELLRILHWDGTVVAVSGRGGDNAAAASRPGADQSPSSPASSASSASRTAKTRPTNAARGKTTPASRGPARQANMAETGDKTNKTNKTSKANQASPTQALLPGSRWSAKTPPTLLELATLALQADRFACTTAVSAYVRTFRLRLPQAVLRTPTGTAAVASSTDGSRLLPGLANEEAIRQKVFVAWRLDQPIRFHAGTRELVLYGSQRWADDGNDSDDEDGAMDGDGIDGIDGMDADDALPAWWDLPDGIEAELQFRRACLLRCLASVPRHFLRLYTSRRGGRQCKMGYESSAACDSFQLGEMVKFLYHKDLLFLQDFSCATLAPRRHPPHHHRDGRVGGVGDAYHTRRVVPADYAAVDIHHVLAALRQCPAYQLDKHHVNCGLRSRILPILEYIQAMLGAASLALHHHEWASPRHGTASWLSAAEAAGLLDGGTGYGNGYGCDDDDDDDDDDDGNNADDARAATASRTPLFDVPRSADVDYQHSPQVFRFTRSVASDQRLRLEGSMAADRMARRLFTARRWNWTPED